MPGVVTGLGLLEGPRGPPLVVAGPAKPGTPALCMPPWTRGKPLTTSDKRFSWETSEFATLFCGEEMKKRLTFDLINHQLENSVVFYLKTRVH